MAVPMLSVVPAARSRRVPRTPTHSFVVSTKPFGIYPFMIAPVLPGETLKNLLLQTRVVTDPVVDPLIGWWTEYYFFYVKLRDLPAAVSAACETMILDPSATLSAVATSTDSAPEYFAPAAGNAVPWTNYCLQRVVECYFRDESEAYNNYAIDGVPLAKLNERNWRDSLFSASEMPTGAVADAEDFSDFEARYRTWMLLRQQQMIDMTFEDYLKTFGVNIGSEAKGKPELLRFVRDWAYPSNTIDPTNGAPTSAVSWSVAERADKDRFFTEPGFIFGVTVCRPKTYSSFQKQSAVCMLDNAFAWMPAILSEDPASSLRSFASNASNSPLNGAYASEHILDIRDLYVHGDQFIRNGYTPLDIAGKGHFLSHADDTHEGMQYPDSAYVPLLFADRDPANQTWVRQDGIVKLTILGTQVDT